MLELKLHPLCWRSVEKAVAGGCGTVVGRMATRTLLVAHEDSQKHRHKAQGSDCALMQNRPEHETRVPCSPQGSFPSTGVCTVMSGRGMELQNS